MPPAAAVCSAAAPVLPVCAALAVGVLDPLNIVTPVTVAVEVAEPDAGLVEEPEAEGAEVEEQTGSVLTVTLLAIQRSYAYLMVA